MKRTVLSPSLVVAAALAVGACGGDGDTNGPGSVPRGTTRPELPTDYRPSGHAAAGDVFVHLFEWPWPDIAAECETVLGPAGYDAVQVSPPQEHIVLDFHPWWTRYQPVSYTLEHSRSGTRAEFVDMVDRCAASGVDIYVDAVINHMTAGSGVGTAGTEYQKYSYPGLYERLHFHSGCTVTDYQDAANVQDCELLGLADLNTGLEYVRSTIAGYLIGLVRVGVAGFRIDAAKHIQPVELDSILDLVNETVAADGLGLPYYFAEVIDRGGEAVQAADYWGLAYSSGGVADITEFKYHGVGEVFLGTDGRILSELNPDGPPGGRFSAGAWGLMPADKGVVFIQNHDTQRGGGVSYRDGDTYRVANVWMLAHPYGYPKVMSGYAFDRDSQVGRDMGPPSDTEGATLPVVCADSLEAARLGDWVCEHRDPVIAAMVEFRSVVAGTAITDWWDNGGDAIAFSRGDRGLVAMSLEPDTVTVAAATSLADGTYCDILTGGVAASGCAGTVVTVSGGQVELDLAPGGAVAVHAEARP